MSPSNVNYLRKFVCLPSHRHIRDAGLRSSLGRDSPQRWSRIDQSLVVIKVPPDWALVELIIW